jgi:predicted AAA+ superfamily ATPase
MLENFLKSIKNNVGKFPKMNKNRVGKFPFWSKMMPEDGQMLKRKIEEKLELWWKGKTALFVDGARQVGKTYALEAFAKSKSSSYVYLNFVAPA